MGKAKKKKKTFLFFFFGILSFWAYYHGLNIIVFCSDRVGHSLETTSMMSRARWILASIIAATAGRNRNS